MRPSRFTEEQIIGMLKEQEAGATIVSDNVLSAEGIGACSQSLSVRQHALAA